MFEQQFSEAFELGRIMENMFDTGQSAPFLKDCLEEVEDSEVYLLILGDKVGTVPPGQTKTYTELEYEAALKGERRIFRFVKANFDSTACDNVEEYNQFKRRFEGLPVHNYTDKQSFENKFLLCMSYLLQQPLVNTGERKFYYVLAGIIGTIGVLATALAYYLTRELDRPVHLCFTAVVPLLFACIVLFVLKNVLFPKTLSTVKH